MGTKQAASVFICTLESLDFIDIGYSRERKLQRNGLVSMELTLNSVHFVHPHIHFKRADHHDNSPWVESHTI